MIGAALVGLLLWRFDPAAVLDRLAGADLRLVAPAVAGLVAVHLVGAIAWRQLSILLTGHVLPWSVALRLYYVGQGLGNLTPANLGADAYRLVALANGAEGWRGAAVPIAVQRAGSVVALAVLGLSGLLVLAVPDIPPRGLALGGVVVALGVCVALGLVLRSERLRRLPGAGLLSLGAGLVFHAVSLGLSLALVAALGPVDSPIPVLAALAVARLAILVPFSPAGLGFQEGALAALFVGIGLSPNVALAAALLARLGLLATTGVAAVLLGLGPAKAQVRSAGEPALR
jgi:uncharacterized membrane protein YbhN (UPF0104 family)